jgi:RimJ/RimL family protein N-acetyltransferase
MRRADLTDALTVLDILDTAAARLVERGIRSWPAAWRPEWIEPGLTGGHVWLAEVDGVALATLALYWSDPLWPDDGRAGYVHQFGAARTGTGVGAAMLDWTAAEIRRRDRDRFRLDCAATNPALRAYYERAGFAHRGDVTQDGHAMALYERPVS